MCSIPLPYFFLCLIFSCLLSLALLQPLQAQHNVLGKPGYIFTPSGDWSEQPQARVGLAFIPQQYAINHYMGRFADELMYHATADITPFLRVTLNMTYLPDVPRIGIGDRHIDFSLRLLRERTDSWLPDVSLFFSLPQVNSAADYLGHQALVLTKSHALDPHWTLSGSVGYGSPFFYLTRESRDANREPIGPGLVRKERINNFYLSGLFGAAKLRYRDWGGLLLEHDGRALHGGLYSNLWQEKIALQLNAYGFRQVGAALHLVLPLEVAPRALRRKQGQDEN